MTPERAWRCREAWGVVLSAAAYLAENPGAAVDALARALNRVNGETPVASYDDHRLLLLTQEVATAFVRAPIRVRVAMAPALGAFAGIATAVLDPAPNNAAAAGSPEPAWLRRADIGDPA